MPATLDDLANMLADDERQATAAPKQQKVASGPPTLDDLATMLVEDAAAERAKPKIPEPQPRGMGVVQDPLPTPPPTADRGFVTGKPAAWGEDPLVADPEAQKAAQFGVMYDKPAPAGHGLASFAYNDNERLNAYRMALKQKTGADAVVEVGPDTGQLEYLDPETGRFALVAPKDGNLYTTLSGAAGGSLVAIPELAGNVLGALVSKHPSITAMGGGGGAFVGEMLRLYSGRAMGINQNMTAEEATKKALTVAGLSAATGVIGEKALQFGQFLSHAVDGNAVGYAKKMGDKLGVTMEEAAALQDEINGVLAAERTRLARAGEVPGRENKVGFTIGEASGNKELLSYEEGIKRSPTYQARFGEFNEERQRAFKEFYDVISAPFERASITPNEAKRLVRLRADRDLRFAERRVTEHLGRAEAQARDAIESVDVVPLRSLGTVARHVGDVEYGTFVQRADELATNLRTLAGGAKIVTNKNTAEVFNRLDANARNITIPALRRQTRKAQMLPPKMQETAEGEVKLSALYDGDTKWSFDRAWSTVSRLKQVLRDGGMSDTDTGAIKKVIGAIEKDMDEGFGATELGPAYRTFTDWYRAEKGRLNDGVVGDLFKRENGNAGPFRVANPEVFREVFPETGARGGGGIEATSQFMDLIKHDPQAIGTFRRAIADDWRQYSVVDGRVNPARSAEWMRRHQDQLGLRFNGVRDDEVAALGELDAPKNLGEPLFTPKEIAQIKRAGDFEAVLAAREVKAKKALDAVNASIKGDLKDLDNPGQLVALLAADTGGNQAGKVMRALKGQLDVTRGVQAAYLADMRSKVITGRIPGGPEPAFSHTALRNFLYGKGEGSEKGQLAVIKQVFGPTYAEGLVTLERALAKTAQEAIAPNRSNTSFWSGTVANAVARAYFGVISTEGRVISAATNVSRAASDALFARATMNPANLKKLMAVWNKDVRDRKVATVLAQLGFGPIQFEAGVPDAKPAKSTPLGFSELGM